MYASSVCFKCFVHNVFIILCNIHAVDGAGISDPCEKEAIDAIDHLDLQQREDITISAQVSWIKHWVLFYLVVNDKPNPISGILSML